MGNDQTSVFTHGTESMERYEGPLVVLQGMTTESWSFSPIYRYVLVNRASMNGISIRPP